MKFNKRDIKFRAWDSHKGKFWHDFRIHPFGQAFPATHSENGLWVYENCYDQQYIVLEQSIGLKNNEGDEWYEGDIYDYSGEIGVIKIEDLYFDELMRYRIEKGKKIGNIHENPELLNE